ncbi:glucosylceramidase [Streptomyces sp. 150FB]|uniref:glycoside hydrolase family 30 protein n=1 Tax=Streptomyces sp. 150FB TaxID=1576605 RepID=UPI000588F1DC|nr:glycoside hydrolase family 30 beta sandwich domain-containing protein [Streptomyces sp. 150FB]KIF74165.1 glucosylceramidase [Streptomyces sp. 150FB]
MRSHRNRTFMAAVAATAAVAAALVTTSTPASADPTTAKGAAHAGTHPVRGWTTGPDQDGATTTQLTATPAPATGTPDGTTVRVDPKNTFQTVSGFGASLTDSSARVLYGLAPDKRDQVMADLFDPRTGDGTSFLRQPIGASDFVQGPDYSLDDVPAGQTDFGMRHFSVAHDEKQILPLLRQAEKLNPKLQIVATPWSPPAWMKTGDSMIDGKLIDKPAVYQAYAAYLVKFVKAYAAEGVKVDYLTVQNEPQALNRDNYPGSDMSFEQESKVISALGPALKAAGLHTKILGYDHNWTEHPNDIAAHQAVGEDPEVNYPYDLLRSKAAKWISGTAYHCYAGDASAQTALRASFPNEDIYETECSGGDISTAIDSVNNWAKSVVYWNIALDEKHGPHQGGCGDCDGTVTVNSATKDVTYTSQYYALGHFSRFVEPGAVRIASNAARNDASTTPVTTSAFVNPDRSTAVVVNNSAKTAEPVTVLAGGSSFTATLAPGATATYTWPAA